LVWTQGNRIMFLGVRTYRLTPSSNDTTTFEKTEVFSGVMLPMVAGRLPDFKPIFERYAADLKREAEATDQTHSDAVVKRRGLTRRTCLERREDRPGDPVFEAAQGLGPGLAFRIHEGGFAAPEP
jgi:hypothetical protein